MANVSVTVGFNQSKHQMTTAQAADGVALPNILGTHLGLMIKDSSPEFNQVSLKSRFYDVIDYAREQRVLNRIQAGEFGTTGHVMLSIARDRTITFNIEAGYLWWDAAPTDTITIAIPIESGWVKDGSTVYLTNTAKRLFEKVRETYLVYL